MCDFIPKARFNRNKPGAPLFWKCSLLASFWFFCILGTLFGWSNDPFAECHLKFKSAPDKWESSGCFYNVSLDPSLKQRAANELLMLTKSHPKNGWLFFNLGRIYYEMNDPKTPETFEKAAEIFSQKEDFSGAFYAQTNLYKWYFRFEDAAQASIQLDKLGSLVAHMDDLKLKGEYQLQRATHEMQMGQDFEAAYHTLLKTEAIAFPNGPYSMRRDCLTALGSVCIRLGRNDLAKHYYQRLAVIAVGKKDILMEAFAKLHISMATSLAQEQLEEHRLEALQLAKEAAEITTGTHRLDILAEAYRLQGQLELPPASIPVLEKGVAIARELGDPLILADCLGSLAKEIASTSPEKANSLIQEAYEHVVDSEMPWSVLIWLYNRMRVHYETYPAEMALDHAFAALDYVEFTRSSQFLEGSRIGMLSVWAEMYYWLGGMLLTDLPLGQRRSMEQNFQVMERMKARSLLDAMQRPQVETKARADLQIIAKDISKLNRKLFDSQLSVEARGELLTQLHDLEMTYRTANTSPNETVDSPLSSFPTLAEVEATLAPDQAIFAFQISETQNIYGEAIGGSWLLVITRNGTTFHALPDRQQLEPAVRTYLGLLNHQGQDQIFQTVSASLYGRILAPAFVDLDPQIKRLMIIPDGPLHRLPFSSLHAKVAGEPLIENFQFSRIPSATVWWHSRDRQPLSDANGGLVFADPALNNQSQVDDLPNTRSWAMAGGSDLDPLPLSRQEGENVMSHLGTNSQLYFGGDASESQLKQIDLSQFQVLHFAAHAMVDEASPHRSAVILSRGDDEQDGLLQPNEIERLSLQGHMVVLSTCSSASGQILRGEGTMSLARGFIKAGASVVVATLQPLRDDHASFFFDHFYQAIARKHTVASAIQTAQQACIDAGLPPSAWSPVVAICRDDIQLTGVAPPGFAKWPMILLILAFVLATAIIWRTRRPSP